MQKIIYVDKDKNIVYFQVK